MAGESQGLRWVVGCQYDACDVGCGMDGVCMCRVVVLDGLCCSDCGM